MKFRVDSEWCVVWRHAVALATGHSQRSPTASPSPRGRPLPARAPHPTARTFKAVRATVACAAIRGRFFFLRISMFRSGRRLGYRSGCDVGITKIFRDLLFFFLLWFFENFVFDAVFLILHDGKCMCMCRSFGRGFFFAVLALSVH